MIKLYTKVNANFRMYKLSTKSELKGHSQAIKIE